MYHSKAFRRLLFFEISPNSQIQLATLWASVSARHSMGQPTPCMNLNREPWIRRRDGVVCWMNPDIENQLEDCPLVKLVQMTRAACRRWAPRIEIQVFNPASACFATARRHRRRLLKPESRKNVRGSCFIPFFMRRILENSFHKPRTRAVLPGGGSADIAMPEVARSVSKLEWFSPNKVMNSTSLFVVGQQMNLWNVLQLQCLFPGWHLAFSVLGNFFGVQNWEVDRPVMCEKQNPYWWERKQVATGDNWIWYTI